MSQAEGRCWDQETTLVAWLAACVSLVSFFFYLRHGDVLLYGDAVAHINIARRVFDSRTPGLLQLGTVWLPLPHLLMIPFLLSDRLWQTGVGGSIPSLVAYVVGVVGIFRLMRESLGPKSGPAVAARVAAWGAVLIYAANPNLIYLQSTAMTEPVYLAFFIWAVVYFCRFVRAAEAEPKAARSSLLKCGWCLAGACLSRYDGWFLAGVVGLAGLVIAVKVKNEQKALRRTVAEFLLLAAVAPVFWLAYNAVTYRKALEFANGPYSAKAIEERTATPGGPPHPGARNLPVAASYFLKAAELNMMESNWGRLWLVLLLAGTAFLLVLDLGLWPLLLLWVQFPFYMLSIAYGGVPIFLPPWWPHSLYNTRYGIELLPAFAAFGALAVYFPTELLRRMRVKAALAGAMGLFIAVSYAAVWRAQPICFREAWANSRTRIVLEQELAKTLKMLPPHSTLLMYLGDHPGALEDAGIPLRRLIYEGNHRPWMQPSDPDGLWERALADPSKYADFVVASDGDAISTGVNRRGLTPLVVIHVMGQPTVTIYSTHGSAPAA
jgi:hypothetical protein